MIKDLPEGETHFDAQAEFIEKKCAEFVEKGAAIEHVRWAKWQNYLHSCLSWNITLQAWVLPNENRYRWQQQIQTYYAGLSEKEKEMYRKEARNYIPLLRKVLAEAESMAREDEADRCEIHTQTALQKQRKELVEEVGEWAKDYYSTRGVSQSDRYEIGQNHGIQEVIKDLLSLLKDYKTEK